jgi:tricorn protease
MSKIGYYRHPAIFGDSVVFACEGDLWQVTIGGDIRARRLTTTAAGCLHPRFSRDGEQIAFSGREDGPRELYVIPSVGGAPTRLTYMGNKNLYVSAWTKEGKILFSADAESPFSQVTEGFEYDQNMDRQVSLSLGMMISIALGDDGASVIGRNNYDPAKWKRYRGGMKGQLWLKGADDDTYKTILEELNGNIVWPMWVSDRIFFLSDHDGVGNIYSVNRKGEDVQKHTSHTDYYARFPSTDGKRIVYSAGADIWLLDPETGENVKLEITVPRTTNASIRLENSHDRPRSANHLTALGRSAGATRQGKSSPLSFDRLDERWQTLRRGER